jgi:hypothetical protein
MKSLQKEDFKHNVLVAAIDKKYGNTKDLYEYTRKNTCVEEQNLNDIELVLSKYKQKIIGVYRPFRWIPSVNEKGQKHWIFEGKDVSLRYPQYMNQRYVFENKENTSLKGGETVENPKQENAKEAVQSISIGEAVFRLIVYVFAALKVCFLLILGCFLPHFCFWEHCCHDEDDELY